MRYYTSYIQSHAVKLPIPPEQLRVVRRIARRTGAGVERVLIEALEAGLRGAEAALQERGSRAARRFLEGDMGDGEGKGGRR